MALSARPSVGPSTPSVPSSHTHGGGRNVASVSYTQVEEVSAQTGVQPDANSNFAGFSDWRGKRQAEPELLRNVASNFSTTTSTFLTMVNQEQDKTAAANQLSGVKGAFQGLLSKAIRAYEGTASVINGETKPRGTSYSASL